MPFHDARETQDPALRERSLLLALPQLLAHALARTTLYPERFGRVDPAAITSRAALAQLPVLRKSELVALQRAHPPFGGLAALSAGGAARVFASPGPIYEPEPRRPDPWRMARALFAAGFRAGELLHNSFAYHLTPAGSMLESGAHALGCAVFPAGTGQTELQISAMVHLKPDGYAGTPSYLKVLLERAAELALDVRSVRKALVSGEPFPASLRAALAERGVSALQAYASADLGLIAYESEAREGLILSEDVLLEIVRPGTSEPLSEGEVGEVVITAFNPDYPLIRFSTGDLSAVLPGPSPCGRTNVRIRGWLGRADQTTKVRGMFVHPGQIAEVLRRHPELRRARLLVSRLEEADQILLQCEPAPEAATEGLTAAIATSLREVTKLRGEVQLVPPGSLPNDGKVIDDTRTYA